MSEEVREEDEWLYGESAEGAFEGSKSELKGMEADTSSRDGLGLDEEALDNRDDEANNAAAVESMEEESQDGGRGRKRNIDAMEGEGGGTGGASDEEKGDESEDDEDDESDDDGIQVTIKPTKFDGPVAGAGTTTTGVKRTGAAPPDKKGKFSSEDFEGPGQINGVPVQDFNLDALEDKPWRKPGADITDYFNYGFTEDTWKAYCDRQKRLRYEAGHPGHQMMGGDVKYIGVTGQQNIIFPKKFGMQPNQRKDGPMNMMGGMPPMGMGMRRENPNENTIQVMTADRREYSRKQFEMGHPMMPPPFDMSMPPPPFPPRGGEFMGPPPDFFNHPPPGGDYYDDNEDPEYEEQQQWMDSQWEMEEGGSRPPVHNALVVPLTKVTDVPPPPGENEESDVIKVEPS